MIYHNFPTTTKKRAVNKGVRNINVLRTYQRFVAFFFDRDCYTWEVATSWVYCLSFQRGFEAANTREQHVGGTITERGAIHLGLTQPHHWKSSWEARTLASNVAFQPEKIPSDFSFSWFNSSQSSCLNLSELVFSLLQIRDGDFSENYRKGT